MGTTITAIVEHLHPLERHLAPVSQRPVPLAHLPSHRLHLYATTDLLVSGAFPGRGRHVGPGFFLLAWFSFSSMCQQVPVLHSLGIQTPKLS